MKKNSLILLVITIALILSGCSSNKGQIDETFDAKKMFDQMMEYDDFSKFVTEHKTFTKKTDPEGRMGKPNEYTSKVSWAVDKLNDNSEEKYNGGTIKVFKNEKDAKMYHDFIELYTKRMSETFTEDMYGNYALPKLKMNQLVHQNRNVVLSIWATIDEGFVDSYFKEMDESLEGKKFLQEDVPTKNSIEKMVDDKILEFETSLTEEKILFENELNIAANEIDQQIDAYVNGDTTYTLTDIGGNLVDKYVIGFFDQRRSNWFARIDQIRKSYNPPTHASFTKGTYVVGVDIAAGTYNMASTNIDSSGSIRVSEEEKSVYSTYYQDEEDKYQCYLKSGPFKFSNDQEITITGDEAFVLVFTPSGEATPNIKCTGKSIFN